MPVPPPDPIAIETARATWAAAVGSILSAAAAAGAAWVALIIASNGVKRENDRLEQQRHNRIRSFRAAVHLGLDSFRFACESLDDPLRPNVALAPLIALLESGADNVTFALTIEIDNYTAIEDALNIRLSLRTIVSNLKVSAVNVLNRPAASVASYFASARPDFDAWLEKYSGPAAQDGPPST
jgi:hypothetical protein